MCIVAPDDIAADGTVIGDASSAADDANNFEDDIGTASATVTPIDTAATATTTTTTTTILTFAIAMHV